MENQKILELNSSRKRLIRENDDSECSTSPGTEIIRVPVSHSSSELNLAVSPPKDPEKICSRNTALGKRCTRKCLLGKDHCFQHTEAKFIENKPDDCAICCDSLANQRRALSCGHWIHLNCVIKSGRAVCPVCRAPLIISKRARRKIIDCARRQNLELLEAETLAIQEELALEDGLQGTLYDQIYTIVALLLEDPDNVTSEILDDLLYI